MKTPFKKLCVKDRPREKIRHKGVENLSNVELVATIIGKGTQGQDVYSTSRKILKTIESTNGEPTIQDLLKIYGMGSAKSSQILAAFELSKRFLLKEHDFIYDAEDIYHLVRDLKTKRQEHFVTLTVDGAGRLIKKRVVFVGTVNQSLVHPREVFADAIHDRAASLVLVHNHPSGNLVPSSEDVELTQRLVEVSHIVGIPIVDHLIVSSKGYYSFHEEGDI